MADIEYLAPETRATIERMCSYLDDGSIARYFGLRKETVVKVRERMTRPKRGRPPRQNYMIATKSGIQDSSIAAADVREKEMSRKFCDTLLRSQLEAGQHSLNADQFYAVCQEKGWIAFDPARKSEG